MDLSNTPFIFIIGFNKSATTSLHKLFSDNGYPSIHWDRGNLARNSLLNTLNGRKIFEGYDDKYRIYSDFIVRNDKYVFEGNSLFQVMDIDYPNSFFIYNYRDMNGWIESRINHISNIKGLSLLELQFKLLNTNDIQAVKNYWKATRLKFEFDIRNYFAQKNNLIELDIDSDDVVEHLNHKLNLDLNPMHWKRHNRSP
jgi:hypothetical protein